MDSGIRYVALYGDDAYDGLSWRSPKRTVAAAVKSLPFNFAGTGAERYVGKVLVGAGDFVETDLPIPMNAGLTVEGVGTGSSPGEGTRIITGAAGHLFGQTPGFDDWNHHNRVIGAQLQGDPVIYPGDFDLIHWDKPGFNTVIRDVYFREASRFGLKVNENTVNLFMYNVTGANCVQGLMKLHFVRTANTAIFKAWGLQFDDCGQFPIQIEGNNDGGINVVSIDGLEAEATGPTQHDAIVRYDRIGGDNPIFFNVRCANAWRAGGGGTAFCYEAAPKKGNWVLEQIHTDGYAKAFKSDAQAGRESDGAKITKQEEFVWIGT